MEMDRERINGSGDEKTEGGEGRERGTERRRNKEEIEGNNRGNRLWGEAEEVDEM